MINFKPFFDDLDNDTESIQMILMVYLEDYNDCHLKLRALFDEQQWSQLFILVHSLKGILEGFGEEKVTAILQQVEAETRHGGPAGAQHIETICSQLPLIQVQIEQELAAIS